MSCGAWACVTTLALVCACGGDDGPDQSDSSDTTSDIGITLTGPMTGQPSTTGMKFDLAADDTGMVSADDGPTPQGCRKVDTIISVDNSSSMTEEIEALAGPVFDSFPTTLLDVNNGLDDFQLAVIDACNTPPFFHDTGASGACDYSTGKNFMVSTSPDLLGEYQCATEFTTAGFMGQEDLCSGDNDDEQPSNTAADAVSAPAAMAENAGFVRDDAILFIVAITDEDEQPTPARTAQEIADTIIAAKGTIDNVVFLGIGGDSECEGPYGGAEEADLLREVALIFAASNRGLFWDLCDGDLEGAFAAALQIVDGACEDFEPVG